MSEDNLNDVQNAVMDKDCPEITSDSNDDPTTKNSNIVTSTLNNSHQTESEILNENNLETIGDSTKNPEDQYFDFESPNESFDREKRHKISNELISCDKCNVCVHQICYGIR